MDDPSALRLDPAWNMMRFNALLVTLDYSESGACCGCGERIGRKGQRRTQWFRTKAEAEDVLRALEQSTSTRKRTMTDSSELYTYSVVPSLPNRRVTLGV